MSIALIKQLRTAPLDSESKLLALILASDADRDDRNAFPVREAWRLSAPDVPFGFEFISRVTFRDVNFGELSKPGDRFKVAGQDRDRPGFTLCRHCGKV